MAVAAGVNAGAIDIQAGTFSTRPDDFLSVAVSFITSRRQPEGSSSPAWSIDLDEVLEVLVPIDAANAVLVAHHVGIRGRLIVLLAGIRSYADYHFSTREKVVVVALFRHWNARHSDAIADCGISTTLLPRPPEKP